MSITKENNGVSYVSLKSAQPYLLGGQQCAEKSFFYSLTELKLKLFESTAFGKGIKKSHNQIRVTDLDFCYDRSLL